MEVYRGVVRNFNPWVPKLCRCEFGFLGYYISKFFTCMDPLSSKSVGSISYFSKIHGFQGTHGTHANYTPGIETDIFHYWTLNPTAY